MNKEFNYQITYKLGNLEEETLKTKVLPATSVYDVKELFYELTPEFDKEKSRIISIVNHVELLEDDFEFPEPPIIIKEIDYLHSVLLEANGWSHLYSNFYERNFKNTCLRVKVNHHTVSIYEAYPMDGNSGRVFWGKNVKTIEDLNFILDKIGVEEI